MAQQWVKKREAASTGPDPEEKPEKHRPCFRCGAAAYCGTYISPKYGGFGEAAFEKPEQVQIYLQGAFLVDAFARNNHEDIATAMSVLKDLAESVSGRKVQAHYKPSDERAPKSERGPVVPKAMTGKKQSKEELYAIAAKATGRTVEDLQKQCQHPTNKGLEVMRLRNIINAAVPKD